MEMLVDVIIDDSHDGVCRERLWQDVSADEQQMIREKLTDKAMAALGYERIADD